MVPRSFFFGFAIIAGVPVLLLLMVVAFAVAPRSSFRHAKVGGAFAMTEITGRAVTERDFLGKPLALSFGFTNCPDLCPTTLATLSSALERMGGDAGRLNVVFVTLDPQRDTAEQMREYLGSFDPRIRGLVGTPEQTAAMADTFHIRYRSVTVDGHTTLDHSAGVSLFDRGGELVGEIAHDAAGDEAFAKLETLVQPKACIQGAPPRVDLWSGALLGSSCGKAS